MKRILTLGVILLFIGMSISSSSSFNLEKKFTTQLNGKTLYVGGSGPGNYTKIQDAIDNASDGDTVFVYDDSSPYFEYNIEITKSINLFGENRNTTVIDANSSGNYKPVISIDADWVNISGFTLNNSSYEGIEIRSDFNQITDNIIVNNTYSGIGIWGYGWPIYANNIITNNIIKYNGEGIYVNWSSPNNTISKNVIFSNGWWGIYLEYWCHNTTISDNIISNHTYSGINVDSTLNVITGNVISNNTRGLDVGNKSNEICENLLYNNKLGIRIGTEVGYNNSIYHNNFFNNEQNAYDYLGSNNTWDDGYPSGGNYWDDYTGNDSDGDGIGDTPYPIPGGGNEDRYPLMKPWNGSYDRPYGPSKGFPGINYTFCFDLPVHPEGDSYYVMWDWGDGSYSPWFGPYVSGETVCATHSWTEPGEYHIRVKLKDELGEGNWSLPFIFTVIPPAFEIKSIRGGLFRVTTEIKNIAEITAPDVHWRITLVGGIILIGRVTEGVIPNIPSGEEVIIKTGLIVGFGAVKIIVEVWIGEEPPEISEYSGFVFLFFIKINS